MSDPERPSGPPAARPSKARPHTTAETRTAQAEREARLAAALRENLKRRKAQARAQGTGPALPGDGDDPAGSGDA